MRDLWRIAKAHPAGAIAALFILALAVAAILAPVLFPIDPNQIGNEVLQGPSRFHLLGTDELGRDALVDIVYGSRVSLTIGILAAFAATLIGAMVGAICGFRGGLLDLVMMRVAEIFQVTPSFVLAALIIALSKPGLPQIVTVIAILAWPQTARLMRGEVLRIKQLEFVDAVRCQGAAESVILAREIIPNAFGPVLAIGTLIIGQAILLEASLGFLGLSSPEIVSWGRMLNSGQKFLFSAWWLSLFPGAAIFLTVLAFNLIGDAMGIALNLHGGGGTDR